MTYTKQTWADGEQGGTPITAARLTHMEDGIAAAGESWFVEFSAYPGLQAQRRLDVPPGFNTVGEWLVPLSANESVVADAGIYTSADLSTPHDLAGIQFFGQLIIDDTGAFSPGVQWQALWVPEVPFPVGGDNNQQYHYLDVTQSDAESDHWKVAEQSAGGSPIQAPMTKVAGVFQIAVAAVWGESV